MKRFFKVIKVLIAILLLLGLCVFLYMQQPQFGKAPSGDRLARIEQSPNYRNGSFHNRFEKPTLTKGYSFWNELYQTAFGKFPRKSPVDELPNIKTDLKHISLDSNVVVWLGHSSLFIQLDGKRILVDPVFSGHASPLPGTVKAYLGSNTYTVNDLPAIDYVLISHDHYDHLDYETMLALKNKVKFVVCGLGVGAHLEYWGYQPKQIIEKDWDESVEVNEHFSIHTESSHHESGRGFIRGKTLWMSYLIQSKNTKIYISGDGGFDNRFALIGKKYGPIDWAILECGQYDKAWQSVHNLPEEVVQAASALNAKNLISVHHSKFTLGKHPWDEPLTKLTALSANQPYRLVTPIMGEVVNLNQNHQQFKQWWKGIN